MRSSMRNPVRSPSVFWWGLSYVPCSFTVGSPMFFPVCYTCVPREFSLTFSVYLLWVPHCLFLSDTPCIHCLNRAIYLGCPCVPRAFPRIFGSCFLMFFNIFLHGSPGVPVIFALPSLFLTPRVSYALNCSL